LRRDPDHGVGKERSDVNPFTAYLLVSARQDALFAEAAAERLARTSTTPADRQNPLTDAARSLWSLLSGPAERPATIPTLTNYPFRG
jgi:hypothetical protein